MGTTGRRLMIQVNKLWRQVVVLVGVGGRNNTNKIMIIIPNDIVVEILLRLPAESLIRLRWACKYWFNLITRDRHFIKMHHLHHSTTTHQREIIMSILSLTYGTISCWKLNYNYFSTFHISEDTRVDIQLPFKYAKTLGSCNGLILLCEGQRDLPGEEKKLCILNPCTKEYRFLPSPLYRGWHNYYGFVYDHTTDDYKVIVKQYSRIRDDLVYSDVQVYTLGTNSWRIIKTKSSRRLPFKKGVFVVNGDHGLRNYWMDSYRKNIISFDIGNKEEEEEFQDVPKPPNLGDDWYNAKLHVFEGSLCMVIKIKVDQHEMWVMNNNNNNNKEETLWTKVATIPYPHLIKFPRYIEFPPRKFHPIKPLRYTRNGEILILKNRREFVLYKPNYGKYSNTTLGRMGEYLTYNCAEEVYTDSLVSLNSGTYTTQEQKNNKKKKMQEPIIWNGRIKRC